MATPHGRPVRITERFLAQCGDERGMLRGAEASVQLGEHAGEVAGEERTRGEMHPRERSAVFTIGHSNHSLEGFFALLGKHRVATVADVRSVPYSRFVRHFSRQPLASALAARGIDYLFLGRELGGRPDDPGCYERGRIVYERVAGTESFRDGIRRVLRGSAEQRIALMCAEREPLDCHRTLLVAPALEAAGEKVVHILADGALERNRAAMDRLIRIHGLQQGDLFRTRQSRTELIRRAIALQAGRVGYVNAR